VYAKIFWPPRNYSICARYSNFWFSGVQKLLRSAGLGLISDGLGYNKKTRLKTAGFLKT